MKKRIISFVLMLSMFGMFVPTGLGNINAYAASSDFEIEDGVLVAYHGNGDSVTIPSTVYYISEYAFEDCTNVTAVTIPDSVNIISIGAFKGCTGIKSVSLPNSFLDIGESAFCDCTGLTSITIPKTVLSIDYNAFEGCDNLKTLNYLGTKHQWHWVILDTTPTNPEEKSIGLDESVIKFKTVSATGDFIINEKGELLEYKGHSEQVVIPSEVKTIDVYAFAGCRDIKKVTIPNSVTSIGDSAFTYCSNLTNVTIPDSVTDIGEYAFSDCPKLSSVSIPNSVKEIKMGTFSDCTGLTNVTIPNSVTYIDDFSFYGCTALKSVTIPKSVTYIGGDAFYDCENLTSVYILFAGVEIGGGAFGCCSKVKDVYFAGTKTQWGKMVSAREEDSESGLGFTEDTVIHYNYGSNALAITKQPSNAKAKLNASVSVAVKANGKGLKYQWYYKKSGAKSWSKWKGKTKSSVSFKMTKGWDNAQFYCLVKDSAGKSVKTKSVKVTLAKALKITTQPKNKTVKKGKTATFSIKATGNSLKYQWYYKKKGAKSWTKWSGKTKASVSLKATKAWNGAQFYCKVTDGNKKTANSKSAKLKLK